MAVTSGFFNSLNGDRKYNSEQFSALFDNLIKDGVFANVGDAFSVKAGDGNSVTVGVGRAWFNSVWVYNDALLPLFLNGSEVLIDRIDAVVIEINHTDAIREGRIRVVNGVPSSNPSRPELINEDDVHQYPLAYIRRPAGSASVNQADITNMIGTSSCPYVSGILETQNIDKVVAQWQAQFNIWFDSLDTYLDGDTAATLANRVIELESRFETLAEDHAVTSKLQDSNGETILDSYGSEVFGATVFSEKKDTDNPSQGGSSEIKTESPYKVGDILNTTRTNLDKTWLLCNGAELSREEYSLLSSYLPFYPSGDMTKVRLWTNVDTSYLPSYVQNVRYVNGYYFAVGSKTYQAYNSGNYHAGCIISYATNPKGPWTTIDLFEKTLGSSSGVYDITYADGKYVICGTRATSSPEVNVSFIAYATSPGGPWTKIDMFSDYASSVINTVKYLNGVWVVGGYASTATGVYAAGPEVVIAYSKTLTGSWTKKSFGTQAIGAGIQNEVVDIIYDDGKYAALYCLTSYGSDGYGKTKVYIAHTSDLFSDDWTTVAVYSPVDNSGKIEGCRFECIKKIGEYYLAGYRYIHDNKCDLGVAYSKELDGPWAFIGFAVNIPNGIAGVYDIDETDELIVAHGYWNGDGSGVVTNNVAWILKSRFLVDYFTAAPIVSLTPSDGAKDDKGMVITDKYMVVAGCGQHFIGGEIAYLDKSILKLPTISLSDSVYSYIKVKEE